MLPMWSVVLLSEVEYWFLSLDSESSDLVADAIDPQRQAVLLVGGDKSGQWKQWYAKNVPLADTRYTQWLHDEQREGS